MPSVITSLLRGEPARCSHGNQLRDFLYVKDVAAALVALLESDFQGPVNIASGQAVTLKTIINTIADRLDGAGLLRLGARPVPEGEPAVLLADTRLLREKVGWEPAYTLEQGLEAVSYTHLDVYKRQDQLAPDAETVRILRDHRPHQGIGVALAGEELAVKIIVVAERRPEDVRAEAGHPFEEMCIRDRRDDCAA